MPARPLSVEAVLLLDRRLAEMQASAQDVSAPDVVDLDFVRLCQFHRQVLAAHREALTHGDSTLFETAMQSASLLREIADDLESVATHSLRP
jgi:hypothetical protein